MRKRSLNEWLIRLLIYAAIAFAIAYFWHQVKSKPVMSESQNIEQSPEDRKSESQEEVHSNISPEQTITPAELSNQTSEIPKSEITTSDILTRVQNI